jgi:proteic killer suppression protein
MVSRVVIAKRARQQLRRVPGHIVSKLMAWIEAVEEEGLEATRRVPGFHDESLKGTRRGQRSIRLSRQWRAIYEIRASGGAQLVSVEEVTPHDY